MTLEPFILNFIMEILYTTEDLVQLLRVSPRTIHRERVENKLRFIKIRGRIRYREEDVRDYLKHQYPSGVAQGTLGRSNLPGVSD